MKSSLLEIEPTRRVQHKTVRSMMRIGRIEAMHDPFLVVRLAVAIGVFKKPKIRRLGHQHSPIPMFKSGRAMEVIGKGGHLVGLAIAIGILKDQQLIVHRLFGLKVGIGWPNRHPKAALGVPGHLHRVDQFGKCLLRSEQVDLEVFPHFHQIDRFLPRKESMFAFKRTGLVGFTSRNGGVLESEP